MKPKKAYPKEVNLNGEWMPSEKASISVFDRGFMLGDGVYEVTPFYKGKAFKMQAHLDRLNTCLEKVKIKCHGISFEQLMHDAVERAELSNEDCAVYIQVTRGVGPRSHFYPEHLKPTVLCYAFPVNLEGFEENSWKVMVSKDLRWHCCDIKSISLMANIMANEEAIVDDFHENLLVRKGYFTEGSHTSIFFVKQGSVYTHPNGQLILPGITRDVIIDICKELEITVKEEPVHFDELVEVDEVFLTGTTTQVMAVNSMYRNGKEVFSKIPGPVTKKIQERFIEVTRGGS